MKPVKKGSRSKAGETPEVILIGEQFFKHAGGGKYEEVEAEAVKAPKAKKAAKRKEGGAQILIIKQGTALVIDEEQVTAVTEGLESASEQLAAFAETVGGKTPQDGMVIFSEEDLASWMEARATLEAVGAVFAGPSPEEDVDASEHLDDEEEDKFAKSADKITKLEEDVKNLTSAVGDLMDLIAQPGEALAKRRGQDLDAPILLPRHSDDDDNVVSIRKAEGDGDLDLDAPIRVPMIRD